MIDIPTNVVESVEGDDNSSDAIDIANAQPEAPLHEKKIDEHGRAYGTGRRKNATARVWIKPGKGKITVNNREFEVFFKRPVLRMIVNQAFKVTNREGQFDVFCSVTGGGLSGQAGALLHGLARALLRYEPELHKPLKTAGFLTRDPRVVERKKYGRPGARKKFQFSKR